MIHFEKHTLSNGLVILVHNQSKTPLTAVSVLYRAGSKYEHPNQTGIAHVMEHMMFSGTNNVSDYDGPIQEAGGDNNAYTNSDIAHFYEVIPAQNLEIALWLESDRMKNITCAQKKLRNQLKVVREEFYETCLNEPFGDAWHYISELCYHNHPYQWPTIGKNVAHIESITQADVRQFYRTFYSPNNAVLSISGNIDTDLAFRLVEQWFQPISAEEISLPTIPTMPRQHKPRFKHIHAKVPSAAIYIAFPMSKRVSDEYYAADILSDILSNGRSSRLVKSLFKKKNIVSYIDSYVSGTQEEGLLIIVARPEDGVSLETIERLIWEEINLLVQKGLQDYELMKWVHKLEASLLYSESLVVNNAINLAYYESIGDVELINNETNKYRTLTNEYVMKVAQSILVKSNSNTIYYHPISS